MSKLRAVFIRGPPVIVDAVVFFVQRIRFNRLRAKRAKPFRTKISTSDMAKYWEDYDSGVQMDDSKKTRAPHPCPN